MANSKKRLFTVLSVMVVMCLMMFTLTACGTDSVVKFMVQEDNGEWGVREEVTVKDGEVTAPNAPQKDYYSFAGWYLDKEGTNKFTAKDIKENIEVYAKYTPISATIIMDGVFQGKKNLIDVKANNAGIVAKEGLTFDGWYKDATCKAKWNNETDVQVLYARSVATITFNNGLETLGSQQVPADSIYVNPSEKTVVVEGKEVSLISTMVKPYMSPMGIDYVDAEGKAIDFTKPVTKNMDITVLWNSPFHDSNYRLNPKTGKYTLEITNDLESPFGDGPVYEVVSIRSTATVMQNDVAKKIDVEAILVNGGSYLPSTVKKIIIGEGIKSIKGLNGVGACAVEEVVIPSTTKIIDGSFNNMPNVKGFNIPDGVEVIIGSFFKDCANDYKTYYMGTPYDFYINIPASVKNMAMVPNNLIFADGSKFYEENDYIFLDKDIYKPGQNSWDKPVYVRTDRVLISDPNAYANFNKLQFAVADTIVVPECDQIQVGTYNTIFDYLILPANFKYVNYNENISNYKYYSYMEGSDYSFSSNMLYDETAKEAPFTAMGPQAYAITNYLGGWKMRGMSDAGAGIVVFPTETAPETLDKFAFSGDPGIYAIGNGQYKDMTNSTLAKSVVFKDKTNKAYISCNFAWVTNIPEYEMRIDSYCRTLEIYTEGALDKETIVAALLAKVHNQYGEMDPNFATNLQTAVNGARSIKFFVNGKEVDLASVNYTADTFITMKIDMDELVIEVPSEEE